MRHLVTFPWATHSDGRVGKNAVTIVMAVIYLLGFCPGPVVAAPPRLVFTKESPGKQFTSYTVEKGDHLYAIIRNQGFAEKNIPEIMEGIHKLNPELDPSAPIYPGQIIRLPLGPKAGQKATSSPRKQQGPTGKAATAVPAPFLPTTYTFKRGDTLIGVLQQKTRMDPREIMGSYMQKVLAANPEISNIDLVHPGQSVTIPRPARFKQPAPDSPKSVTPDKPFFISPPPPGLTGLSTDQARAYIRECLEIMGFVFTQGKETFFPLSDKEWLRIDTTATPLIESPWGTSLVLVSPATKNVPTNDLSRAGITLCTVPSTWNPLLVMQSLAEKFPDKLAVVPASSEITQKIGRMHTRVQVDITVHALWSQPKRFFCFHVLDTNQAPFSAMLSALLVQGDIHLVQFQRTRNRHLVRIDHPQIRKEDIYIPTISHSKLHTLTAHQWGQPFPVPGLAKAPEIMPRKAEITLYWTAGRARIALVAHALQLDGEDHAVVLLDHEMKDPYLVALLELKGVSCHALIPAQAPTH